MHKRRLEYLTSFRPCFNFDKMRSDGSSILIFCLILGTAGGFLFSALRTQKPKEMDPGSLLRRKIQLCDEFCGAAERGDLKEIIRLVNNERISPNQPRTPLSHETPLALALKNRHWNIVRYLLSKRASPNIGRCNGFTLLEYAILQENNDLAALFVKYGANVNQADRSGNPMLFTAIRRKNHTALHILLKAKADPNRKGRGKRTALHEAVLHNDIRAAVLLLNHHAEVNAQDCLLETPLHLAVRCGNTEIMKLLLECGADPMTKNAAGKAAVEKTESPCGRNAAARLTAVFPDCRDDFQQAAKEP